MIKLWRVRSDSHRVLILQGYIVASIILRFDSFWKEVMVCPYLPIMVPESQLITRNLTIPRSFCQHIYLRALYWTRQRGHINIGLHISPLDELTCFLTLQTWKFHIRFCLPSCARDYIMALAEFEKCTYCLAYSVDGVNDRGDCDKGRRKGVLKTTSASSISVVRKFRSITVARPRLQLCWAAACCPVTLCLCDVFALLCDILLCYSFCYCRCCFRLGCEHNPSLYLATLPFDALQPSSFNVLVIFYHTILLHYRMVAQSYTSNPCG